MGRKESWVDYSHEVKVIQSKPIRLALIATAFISLIIGFIGIFLPLLPTTPFVLLAAACYAKSSVNFYNWLMNHKLFGPDLRQWVQHRCIKKKSKIIAISVLWISLLPTIIFVVPILGVKILLAFIGLSVSLFISSRPSEPAI